jgi:hypothetical protein
MTEILGGTRSSGEFVADGSLPIETDIVKPSAEERVFGDAYSFETGEGDIATVHRFLTARKSDIADGKTTWLPREFDEERGAVVELYKDKDVAATLIFDKIAGEASVYMSGIDGAANDTTVVVNVSFAEAVEAAERFAA